MWALTVLFRVAKKEDRVDTALFRESVTVLVVHDCLSVSAVFALCILYQITGALLKSWMIIAR
jgi:hypothetical protein